MDARHCRTLRPVSTVSLWRATDQVRDMMSAPSNPTASHTRKISFDLTAKSRDIQSRDSFQNKSAHEHCHACSKYHQHTHSMWILQIISCCFLTSPQLDTIQSFLLGSGQEKPWREWPWFLRSHIQPLWVISGDYPELSAGAIRSNQVGLIQSELQTCPMLLFVCVCVSAWERAKEKVYYFKKSVVSWCRGQCWYFGDGRKQISKWAQMRETRGSAHSETVAAQRTSAFVFTPLWM